MKVFIVGAGTMGAGIAQTFVSRGHDVWLYDTVEAAVQSGLRKLQDALGRLLAEGQLAEKELSEWNSRIHTATSLNCAADADLVVEAIFENMSVKQELFMDLDAICKPETYFTSNTMSLSITEMSYGLEHAGRMCGMHFFNPAPQTKLVEVVIGMLSEQETVDAIANLVRELGKTPIVLKECAGFVVNRLVMPQINEACYMLMEGIATAEDIDKAMVLAGHHEIGPLHLADELGTDNVLQVLENLQADTGDSRYRPCPLLRKLVRANRLGVRTGEGFFRYDS